MRENELYRQVAAATGESVATVRRLGFLLADPFIEIPNPEDERLGGHVIDWDHADDFRQPALPSIRHAPIE